MLWPRLIRMFAPVIVAGLLCAPAADARCPRRGAHVIAQNREISVLALRGPRGITTYGCDKRHQRIARLDLSAGAGGVRERVARSSVRLAGHFVAYELLTSLPDGSVGALVVIADLTRVRDATDPRSGPPSTGAAFVTPPGIEGATLGVDNGAVDPPPALQIVLRQDGAYAYLVSYPDPTEVFVGRRGSNRQVASSAGVMAGSLRLSPDQRSVTWTESGQTHSAGLGWVRLVAAGGEYSLVRSVAPRLESEGVAEGEDLAHGAAVSLSPW